MGLTSRKLARACDTQVHAGCSGLSSMLPAHDGRPEQPALWQAEVPRKRVNCTWVHHMHLPPAAASEAALAQMQAEKDEIE